MVKSPTSFTCPIPFSRDFPHNRWNFTPPEAPPPEVICQLRPATTTTPETNRRRAEANPPGRNPWPASITRRAPICASLLSFAAEDGLIWLGEHRMLLLHAGAMSELRKELIASVGQRAGAPHPHPHGLRLGHARRRTGTQDAQPASLADAFVMGPQLHMLEGCAARRAGAPGDRRPRATASPPSSCGTTPGRPKPTCRPSASPPSRCAG